MESKVCKVINAKRIHSDDDDDNRNSKQTKRDSSRDHPSTKNKYDKGGNRKYEDLKVGDPYYSGGTAIDNNRKGEDRYKDESRHRRRHNSRDRREKENRSRNADSKQEEKIGAPYYSGGIAGIDERESGEESSDDDDKIGQRYYSTETDTQRKNSENYWNKYANKDKRQNVCV